MTKTSEYPNLIVWYADVSNDWVPGIQTVTVTSFINGLFESAKEQNVFQKIWVESDKRFYKIQKYTLVFHIFGSFQLEALTQFFS